MSDDFWSGLCVQKDQWLRFSELDAVAACFVRLGVRKIRLTGGEPLLRLGLTKYIEGLQQFSEIVIIALTTNGLRLRNAFLSCALRAEPRDR